MKYNRQLYLLAAFLLFCSTSLGLQLTQQQTLSLSLKNRNKSKLRTEVNSETQANAEEQGGIQYKSDALDELLEDSLFKKKKAQAAQSEESNLDSIMKAKVDLKSLNLAEDQPASSDEPAMNSNVQISTTTTQPRQSQTEKDMALISAHLKQYTGNSQPEVGSSMLFGAISDLDLGEANIPAYTPPGMPDMKFVQSQNPNPLALGPGPAKVLDLTQMSSSSLDGQTPTEISVEAYSRGGNKYEEQAEELMQDQESEIKNNSAVQQLVAQAKQAKQEEEAETEELIATTMSNIKTTNNRKANVAQNIKMQNDLALIAAFGDGMA